MVVTVRIVQKRKAHIAVNLGWRTGRDARKVQNLLIFKDLYFWSRFVVAVV